MRREIQVSGKGRATINGALVPVSVLRDLAPLRGDASTASTSRRACSTPTPTSSCSTATPGSTARRPRWPRPTAALREVEGALEALRARPAASASGGARCSSSRPGEIEKAALAPGEEEALRQEKAVQANAGRLAALSAEAYALLYEDEDAVADPAGAGLPQGRGAGRASTRGSRRYLEARAAVTAQLDDLALLPARLSRDARGRRPAAWTRSRPAWR